VRLVDYWNIHDAVREGAPGKAEEAGQIHVAKVRSIILAERR
jgi:DNA-binding FadR family transcriptional regulator